jgi:peptidoglycan-associated lipoprotein
MKATRFVILTAIGLVLSFLAAGCHMNPQNPTAIPKRPVDTNGEVPPFPAIPPENQTNPTMIELPPYPMHTNWVEHPEQFKANTVHFAFDSAVVRSADKSKIAEVADYLKKNTEAAVRVEGNCDERGTEEYNRSLGERRALAAREVLVGLGIDSTRVDTVSYGQDRPVADGHNEDAWKQNRRADFILLTPPAK